MYSRPYVGLPCLTEKGETDRARKPDVCTCFALYPIRAPLSSPYHRCLRVRALLQVLVKNFRFR